MPPEAFLDATVSWNGGIHAAIGLSFQDLVSYLQVNAPTDARPERSEPLFRSLSQWAFGNYPNADHEAAWKSGRTVRLLNFDVMTIARPGPAPEHRLWRADQ